MRARFHFFTLLQVAHMLRRHWPGPIAIEGVDAMPFADQFSALALPQQVVCFAHFSQSGIAFVSVEPSLVARMAIIEKL